MIEFFPNGFYDPNTWIWFTPYVVIEDIYVSMDGTAWLK